MEVIDENKIIPYLPGKELPRCYLCDSSLATGSLRPVGLNYQWVCFECMKNDSKIEAICKFNLEAITIKCSESPFNMATLEGDKLETWPEPPFDEDIYENPPIPKIGVYTIELAHNGRIFVLCQINSEVTVQIV